MCRTNSGFPELPGADGPQFREEGRPAGVGWKLGSLNFPVFGDQSCSFLAVSSPAL